ncbi:MAG: primosomal protein N' [Phycisphaeraceae bacterium]|nr:primosomal protein N' [Phycisphaeraceae bacterium]
MSRLFDPEVTDETRGYARVVPEQGIESANQGLTYAVPASLDGLAVGERVFVPLGRGNHLVPGYVVEISQTSDLDRSKIKTISHRDPGGIRLTPELVQLARWIGSFYICPLGMVLVTMLPAAVKHGTGAVKKKNVRLIQPVDARVDDPAAPAPSGSTAPELSTAAPVRLSTLQKAVLATARRMSDAGTPWLEIRELADEAGARTVGPILSLIQKGYLEASTFSDVRSEPLEVTGQADDLEPTLQLTDSQRNALDAVLPALDQGYRTFLLHGVTASGKTEVYLRAIEKVIQSPRPGVIMLVPEIALTPQTTARFIRRFGHHRVALLHSGLTAAQRHHQWRRVREGEATIVVGARSAVFAPVSDLGLVIVDEEHDASYKQDQLPRYHGRDVAIRRAQMAGCPAILGSATPSLESFYNTRLSDPARKYHLLKMPVRVPGATTPRISIVDMTQERRKRYQNTGKAGIHLLSLRLEMAIRRTIEQGFQVILLLNRRGYANFISCPDHGCGWLMNCESCDSLMVYHKHARLPEGGFVRCHHCDAEQLLPRLCPECKKKVTVFGLGTQRVEEEIGRKFPGVSCVRMDSDSMRHGRDYRDTLEAFRLGEIRVLIGTQMIAKGLDFPRVTLVGVISADTALHLPDFRSGERTFQLIAQVAGRAGRGTDAGEVIVQSFQPEDRTIKMAAAGQYEAFAMEELEIRDQSVLPPVARMARIVVRDQDFDAAIKRADALGQGCGRAVTELGCEVEIRGPAACPISRIAGYHRHQVELIAPPPRAAARLQALLAHLRSAGVIRSDHRMAVDVDPVVLL